MEFARNEELVVELKDNVDCTTLLPVEVAVLPRGTYPKCLAFHPERAILAMGIDAFVIAVDLQTGCRVGRVDLRQSPAKLEFNREGTLLAVATQELNVIAINTMNWRHRVLAPYRGPDISGVEVPLLAVTSGSRPAVFFTKYGKDALRMASAVKGEGEAGSGGGRSGVVPGLVRKERGHTWGLKARLDVKKPIVGLAAHPTDNILAVLGGDGILRAYNISLDSLNPMWNIAVGNIDPPQGPLLTGILEFAPHPYQEGSAMMMQGTTGGSFCVYECLARSEPRVVLRDSTPDGAPVIGMGVHKDSRCVLVFSANRKQKVKVRAWRVFGSPRAPGAVLHAVPLTLDMKEATGRVRAGDTRGHHVPFHSRSKKPSFLNAGGIGPPSWQSLWSVADSSAKGLQGLQTDQLLHPVTTGVQLHGSLGVVALQQSPPLALLANPSLCNMAVGVLSPAEAALSRATATVPLLRVLSVRQPGGFWPGLAVSPLHTALDFWQGTGGFDPKLKFPCHLYYLDGSRLCKYGLASRSSGTVAKLPEASTVGSGQASSLVPRTFVHSPITHKWLVFLEAVDPVAATERGASFRFCLVRDNTPEVSWTQSGKFGTFLGPSHLHFAVLPADTAHVSVYITATCGATSSPLYMIILDRPCKPDPCLYAGPAALLVPDPAKADLAWASRRGTRTNPSSRRATVQDDIGGAKQGEAEGEEGSGVVLWMTSDSKLAMGQLPEAPSHYIADDESSDDEEAGATPNLGRIVPVHELALRPAERLVSVAWQNLTATEVPLAPNMCAAAVLTSQRLLIVRGDLAPVASLDTATLSMGLPHPITSLLWAGPALLFATAAGQVKQVSWDSTVYHVCSVASSPPAVLAGLTADAALLLRATGRGGARELATRAVGVLQPLALGWCGLALAGLLPKGISAARAGLQHLLEHFDAGQVSGQLLWALIGCWCWDVAAMLANQSSSAESSTCVAANAAAGKWSLVLSALVGEYERSVYSPRPAPRGSPLHSKFLACAAGAISHGQFSAARECLRCAGEWEDLVTVMVCQADFKALRDTANAMETNYSTQVGVTGAAQAAEVARMCRAAVAAYERKGLQAALDGGAAASAPPGSVNNGVGPLGAAPAPGAGGVSASAARDWSMRLVAADGSVLVNAMDWDLAGPGKIPQMETSAFNLPTGLLGEGELGPIPRAAAADPGAYLGLSAAAAEAAALAAAGMAELDGTPLDLQPTVSGSGSALGRSNTGGLDDAASDVSSSTATDAAASTVGAAPATSAQAAARADFLDFGKDKDGFISDDDDVERSSEGSFPAARAASKFSIRIRSKDEAAAAQAAAAAASLSEAAKNLRIGPLPGPGAKPGGPATLGLKGPPGTRAKPAPLQAPSAPASAPVVDPFEDFFTSLATPTSQTCAPSITPPGPSPLPTPGAVALPKPPGSTPLIPAPGLKPLIPPPGGAPARPGAVPLLRPPGTGTGPGLIAPPPGSAPRIPGPGAPSAPSAPPPASANSQLDDLLPSFFPAAPMAPSPTPSAPPLGGGPLLDFDMDDLLNPLAPPKGAALTPPSTTLAGPSSPELYLGGVAAMETGDWGRAKGQFAAALATLAREPRAVNHDERVRTVAHYYAAVALVAEAGSAPGLRGARLYRFAAALEHLDDKHRIALLRESVNRNKPLANYRYCADLLTVLISKCLADGAGLAMSALAALQEDLDACDRAGSNNKAIPADENLEDFAAIAAASASAQDLDLLLGPLLRGS